ncbi:MAG: DUF1214 domain-containing protein [Pseudomonadota bacterium]
MKSILLWFICSILGLAIGAISALFMAGLLFVGPKLGGTLVVDGWASDWSIGSETANPYVRARVARHGLLALQKEEAVYFTKATDQSGEPLREACIYRVEGSRLPATWWSITLYDAQSRLPMNTDSRLSFDKTQAEFAFGGDAAWLFNVRASAIADDSLPWVSSRAAGEFDLMLRLYRPTADFLDDPVSVLEPPQIIRLACDGEGE